MDWSTLFETLVAAGIPGVAVGLLILGFVYVGTATDLLKNGDLKRFAVALSGILFPSVVVGSGEANKILVGFFGAAVATLLKLIIDIAAVGTKEFVKSRKQPVAKQG